MKPKFELLEFSDVVEVSDNIVSYQDIVEKSYDLAQLIKNDKELNPTYIMAVARRGCIPATIISLELNLPMGVVSYSSPKGRGQGTTPSARWVMDKTKDMLNTDLVCVVDDICQTGSTIGDLIDIFAEKVNVCSASIFVTSKSEAKPTWYIDELDGFVHNEFYDRRFK